MKNKKLLFGLCLLLVLVVLGLLISFNSKKNIVLSNTNKKITVNLKPNKDNILYIKVKKKTNIVIDNINSSNVDNHYIYLLENERDNIVGAGVLKDDGIIYNVKAGNYHLKMVNDGKKTEKMRFNIKGSNIEKKEFAILDEGDIVNQKIMDIIGVVDNDELDYEVSQKNEELSEKIKSIKIAKKMNDKYKDDTHLVSSLESKKDIYMWVDDDVLYFYSDVGIAFGESAASIFSTLPGLIDIKDLKYFDFSNVINADNMFAFDEGLTNISAISYFNTKSLEEVGGMFSYCYSLSDITPFVRFSPNKLRYMSDIFADTNISDISIMKYFDITKVDRLFGLSGMFSDTYISDITPLKDWNLSNIDNISSMFTGTKIENVDALRDWDVSKVNDMSSIFNGCRNLKNIDGLKNWNTKSLEGIRSAFAYTSIDNLDALKNFNTDNLTEINGAFAETRKLKDISGIADWNVNNVSNFSSLFDVSSIEDISPLKNWDVSNAEKLQSMFGHTRINNLDPIKDWNVSKVSDFSGMFDNTQITNLNALSNWNVSNGKDFSLMFADNSKLTDASGIDNWNVNGKTDSLFEKTNAKYPKWYTN